MEYRYGSDIERRKKQEECEMTWELNIEKKEQVLLINETEENQETNGNAEDKAMKRICTTHMIESSN